MILPLYKRLQKQNGVTKDELVNALRWLYEHYEF